MTIPVIETAGLRKTFGSKVAVADLTLAVAPGEVFAFLGPNGAGKSTSVKMLLGLVAPTSGSAAVFGHRPGAAEAMRRIGFLPEHFRFHPWLQAAELLDLHGRLCGLDTPTRRQRIPLVLERVGLADQARRQLAGFSKGMLQRIGLAQALLHAPDLVFLDEPTSALDPFGRMLVRTIIHELKAAGTTVFLNSHLLGEVEATADRAAFIRHGRVLRTLALSELAAGQLRVILRVDQLSPELHTALNQLGAGSLQLLEPTSSNGQMLTGVALELGDEAQLPLIAEQVLASGTRLYALTPQRMSLEELFVEIVGKEDSGQ